MGRPADVFPVWQMANYVLGPIATFYLNSLLVKSQN